MPAHLYTDADPYHGWLACVVCILLLVGSVNPLFAEQDTSQPGKERIIRSDEDAAVEEEKAEDEQLSAIQQFWKENVELNFLLELNYEYFDIADVEDGQSGRISNFFIGSIKLDLTVQFNEWIRATIVLLEEDIGRTWQTFRTERDELFVALEHPDILPYFIVGKTIMPFGVFVNRLIDDTLAEEVYEINDWGAIFGIRPDLLELDLSLAVYRYPQIIYLLEDFGAHEFDDERPEDDQFESFVANVTIEPIEQFLSMSIYYNDEPGDGARNRTIGGAATLNFWKFILDAEYITALEREKGENGAENKESAAVLSLVFEPWRSFQLVARYDRFLDDNPGDQDGVLLYRVSTGFNQSLTAWIDVPFLEGATLTGEYRYSRFERELDSIAVDTENMVQIQLALEF